MAPSVTRKRPATVFFAALIAILLYFALFPYPLGKEIVARPAWAVAVPQPGDPAASSSPADEARLAPFRSGGLFGYVDPSGLFAHVEKKLYEATLSGAGFVNYTRLGTDWIMYDTRGGRLLSFSGSGYPFLSPDAGRIFVVKSDLSGLTEIDRSGDILWTRDFPALLTTLSVQGDSLLAGLLNGSLVLLNPQGSPLYDGAPPGLAHAESRVRVVLGAAVTTDGQRAASISGIDPQYLTVFDRQGGTLVPRAAARLSSDFRREVRISFSPDGRFITYEDEGSGGLYDPVGRRSTALALPGQVAGIAYPGAGRFAAFVARSAGTPLELLIVRPFTGPILDKTFTAKDLFVGSVEGQLLLGLDGRLVRIDVVSL